jgi:hypothetical protein
MVTTCSYFKPATNSLVIGSTRCLARFLNLLGSASQSRANTISIEEPKQQTGYSVLEEAPSDDCVLHGVSRYNNVTQWH